ncbi:hypothetical protein [Lentimicrobium sp.]|jgi:outer membrane protein assembly factor BamD (BamD/ComL family)|uniref:tetratricopeptide repeat protein n=1 Tax=Lentimicrobium sp. TaxID=2034841 RepID=UPI0025E623E2|nr:hypothetical protein [Lentimicrobium sp.]MCO5257985.1 hypothetical protein [Lentimicrobium sp.]MCO5262087.1 hypothetical protein [Lentimicrobium sp.]HPJ62299.1 hypothetical protein [Lentimicrobium sp.]HPR25503.1 hypothetical protein [Lentimicrobium sp.]HRW68227.1 hypothetical protein [Lentimicrobium sp.]
MKRTFLPLAAGMLMIFAFSCKPGIKKEIAGIEILEKDLTDQAARPDPEKLASLLDAYTAFVDNHPADSMAPLYLYKAINLSMGVNNGAKAMQLTDRMLNEYPKDSRIPEAIFLKAYIYENQLSNLGLALKTYQDFLSRFPEHELADDAQAAIDNLGKSPEELIREFEARAAAQAGN